MPLVSRIENANTLGRANLNAKGVTTDGTETTYEIMSKIADVSGGGSSGVELNIAYGDTAPADTSKLWVKADKPQSITFNSDIDGVESDESLPTLLGTKLHSIASARVGKYIYLFGGRGSSSSGSNGIYKFNTETETIEKLTATLTSSRYGATAVAYGTTIYIFSGENSSRLNEILAFDTVTETCTRLNNTLNYPCISSCGILVGETIYLFGGRNSASSGTVYIQLFDIPSQTATTLSTRLPESRISLTGEIVGTKVYLFGGEYTTGTCKDTIYVFDIETNQISTISTTLPMAMSRMSSSVVGTKIYLFGGYNKIDSVHTPYDTIYVFDTETEEITQLPTTMPSPCCNMASEQIGNNVYFFGGSNGDYSTAYNTISKFSLTHELAENNIEIITAYKNFFNAINTNTMKLEIGVDSVLIGDTENQAENCEAYLHNGTDWQQI